MALKPDVTLSIAKNVSVNGGLKKLYYIENVYRPNATGRNFSEIRQMGLECLGKVGRSETSEVVRLAYESLRLAEAPFRLSLSHVRYLSGLMRSLRIPSQLRGALYENIAAKNPHGLRETAGAAGLSQEGTALLEKAAMLSGPATEALRKRGPLPQRRDGAGGQEIERAIDGLDDLSVLIDFSIRGDEDYYSGLLLCGYLQGRAVSSSQARVRQHDEKNGSKGGAIGCRLSRRVLREVRKC